MSWTIEIKLISGGRWRPLANLHFATQGEAKDYMTGWVLLHNPGIADARVVCGTTDPVNIHWDGRYLRQVEDGWQHQPMVQ